jgi:prevent-host-death family protein
MKRIIQRSLALPAAAGLLLAAGSASAATASRAYRAASCTATGDYAICDAAGNATAPRRIFVHVTSAPDQSALISWDVVCSKGDGAGSKSGQFTASTPVRQLIPHPYVFPDSCVVSAGAQLSNGGNLEVWISYRR